MKTPNVDNRLKALERIFVPLDNWTITAEFSDGRKEFYSAREYKDVKLSAPNDVHVIDRRVTGNVKELCAWLSLVRELAKMDTAQDEEGVYRI